MFRAVTGIGISEDRTHIEREVGRQAKCIGPAIDKLLINDEPSKFPALVVGVIAVRHYHVARVTSLLSPGDWPLGIGVERRMLTHVKGHLIGRPAFEELACHIALLLCAQLGRRLDLQKPSNVSGMLPPCMPLLVRPHPRLFGALEHIADRLKMRRELFTNDRKWIRFTFRLIESIFEQIEIQGVVFGPHGTVRPRILYCCLHIISWALGKQCEFRYVLREQ